MDSVVSLLNAAVIFGTVIMFGALGETVAEKSGSLNLGVPGLHVSRRYRGTDGDFLL